MTQDKSTQLTYEGYFDLANKYLDAYNVLAKKVQNPDPELTDEQVHELYILSEPLMQQAYEFQKMGFHALVTEINFAVSDLQEAIKEATKTIKKIYKVGKFIEVVTDLVAIGAILAVPSLKPASLIVIPDLLKELIDDVNDLKKTD